MKYQSENFECIALIKVTQETHSISALDFRTTRPLTVPTKPIARVFHPYITFDNNMRSREGTLTNCGNVSVIVSLVTKPVNQTRFAHVYITND